MINEEERKKIEINDNTINNLALKIDKLLCALDTKKYSLNKYEINEIILAIKRYCDYRIKENKLENKELMQLINIINKSDLKNTKEVEPLYLNILKLKFYDVKISIEKLTLLHPKSKYYSQKAKEVSKEEGEKIISRFFSLFEK